jgi:glucose/arabinose dehydrogenase
MHSLFSKARLPFVIGLALAPLGCGEDPDIDPRTTADAAVPEDAGPAGPAPTGQQPFSEALLSQLRKPPGFSVGVFARDLGAPRLMAVGPDGTVYVTRKATGDVMRLRDADGDGRAELRDTAVAGIEGVHGVAVHEGKLYVGSTRYVFAGALSPDGSVAMPMAVVLDLPAGGDHPDRAIGFGPDGKLHISVAASCDGCVDDDPEHATMLQAGPDGSGRVVLARGLHNTIGFGWHPTTGELWAADEGVGLAATPIPDELNRITMGAHYGWPYCFGKRQVNGAMAEPAGMTKEVFCRSTQSATLDLGSRSAPFGLVFYKGSQFPVEYRQDAFLALRGSTGAPLVGFKVVRVRFGSGQPMPPEDFLSGFANEAGTTFFARPAGLAVAADGALLVSDDGNGVVYRVSYTGN